MNSAAVIGRQLRHHQNSNQKPGPVVPPTQYRGRPPERNSLVNNDKIDFCLGADADKNFAKFSQQYNNQARDFYPHPAHREDGGDNSNNNNRQSKGKSGSRKRNQKDQRIKFTKHCFCVAFKALSTGVVLLVSGTIMCIIGFYSDTLASDHVRLENGTMINVINKNIKQHLHNMTYVGPVIMGLGGIVVIAACILTFEVRDTLGTRNGGNQKTSDKVNPNDPKVLVVDDVQARSATRTIESNPKESTMAPKNGSHNQAKPKMDDNHNHHRYSSRKNDGSDSRSNLITPKTPLATVQEVVQMDQCKMTAESIAHSLLQNCMSSSSSNHLNNPNLNPNPHHHQHHHLNQQHPNSDRISITSTNLSYGRIPSPVDIELSDPEGCSVMNMAMNPKWKSRCSCSGSPTNSMLMALHKITGNDEDIDHQQHQQRSTITTIPTTINGPSGKSMKMLASIDDLSMYSSQSEDIDSEYRYDSCNHHHNHHNFLNINDYNHNPRGFLDNDDHHGFVDHSKSMKKSTMIKTAMNNKMNFNDIIIHNPGNNNNATTTTTNNNNKNYPILRLPDYDNGPIHI